MNTRNAIWSNAKRTTIDCEIEHPQYGWITFTASPEDVEQHGRDIYARALAGEFGPVAAYVPPPPPTTEELAAQARANRDQLLAATDWTQAADIPQATKGKYAAYRQALRDVPQQASFPIQIEWPLKP